MIQIGQTYRIKDGGIWGLFAGSRIIARDILDGDLVQFLGEEAVWLVADAGNIHGALYIPAGELEPYVPFSAIDPSQAPLLHALGNDEIRITDLTTGGQKGTKEERFDLIPPEAWKRIVAAIDDGIVSPNDDGLLRDAADLMWSFWGGEDSDCLALAGAVALVVMMHRMETEGLAEPMMEVASVYGKGASKYEARNWERGYAWGLSFAAGMRHLTLEMGGESIDEESGLMHLAHFVWHCLTLMTFAAHFPEKDDRSKLR
jgi:hypothetical protein